jgi:hypothetical protein
MWVRGAGTVSAWGKWRKGTGDRAVNFTEGEITGWYWVEAKT